MSETQTRAPRCTEHGIMDCATCALRDRWTSHPRAAEVKALLDGGEPRATEIAWILSMPKPVVREILAALTGQVEYYTGRAAAPAKPAALSEPARVAREHMPESVMPYNLQTVVFKRCAYLEDLIEQKQRAGLKFNFYASELEGIVWLLDKVGIRYERQAHHGMDPERLTPEPEPERPSALALALALAKAEEDRINADPFLREACKAKISYSTEEAAGRAIVRLRSESPEVQVQHAYACDVCHGWHLTSLDAERSDLAKQIVETRRPEKPLPMQQQQEIVKRYRRGDSIEEIAAKFKFPVRAVKNVLADAGYAVSIVEEAQRRTGGRS